MRMSAIVIAGVLSASLVVSSLLIRDGLRSIAQQVREKPVPSWPRQLHLVAGDSKVNLEIGNLRVEQASDTTEAKISIDNLRVIAPATQPRP